MKIGCIVFLVGIVQLGFYQVCHYGNTNYKQQHDQVESGKFKIIKIDSTGKTYIYYARKKDLVYKILTTKDVACKSEKISIGKTYDIELISLLRYEPYKLHINGMKYNGELIKIEPNIIVHDLFESKNINGRCYLSKKIKPDMDVKH